MSRDIQQPFLHVHSSISQFIHKTVLIKEMTKQGFVTMYCITTKAQPMGTGHVTHILYPSVCFLCQ